MFFDLLFWSDLLDINAYLKTVLYCRGRELIFSCSFAAQSEILYTKRSVVAPYALQRTHAISVDEIARRVGYPECQTSWAINEMLRFSKQRFFSTLTLVFLQSPLESLHHLYIIL